MLCELLVSYPWWRLFIASKIALQHILLGFQAKQLPKASQAIFDANEESPPLQTPAKVHIVSKQLICSDLTRPRTARSTCRDEQRLGRCPIVPQSRMVELSIFCLKIFNKIFLQLGLRQCLAYWKTRFLQKFEKNNSLCRRCNSFFHRFQASL